MEWLLIYLFVMVEKIGTLFMFGWMSFWTGTSLILLVILISSGIASSNNEKKKESYSTFGEVWKSHPFTLLGKNISKFLIGFGFVFGCLAFFIPSQKDMAIIVGAGITYEAVTSDTGKRLGGKAIELLEAKINSALNVPTEPSKAKQEK